VSVPGRRRSLRRRVPLTLSRRRSAERPKINSGQVSKWAATAAFLNENRQASVTPAEATQLLQQGWVLLDVSPAEDFAEHHAAGSVSTPSVRYGSETGLRGALRSAALASQGVKPTVEDLPGFLLTAQAALGGSASGVIVACASGGTLRTTQNWPAGQASRSLFAVEALLKAGLERGRVLHLRGGLAAWFADGLPGEGDGEWATRKGRTPSVGGPMYEQDADELM
jgi:rhodanese-related sulfurtransferase